MADEAGMENGENGETPSKKVRRRVGQKTFMQLAQKRKGKPEVISTSSCFYSTQQPLLQPIFRCFTNHHHRLGYFAPFFFGLIVHCRKPRRR